MKSRDEFAAMQMDENLSDSSLSEDSSDSLEFQQQSVVDPNPVCSGQNRRQDVDIFRDPSS